MIKENLDKSLSKGASWNGKLSFIIPIAVLALVVGYFVWWDATHECVEREEQYRCTTEDVCVSYSYDYDYGGYDYGSNYSTPTYYPTYTPSYTPTYTPTYTPSYSSSYLFFPVKNL